MARWTDLAAWMPCAPDNCGDGDNDATEPGDRMVEYRGLVVHTAVGTYDGTIAWQRNPASDVSSHFVVAQDGRIAQTCDTDIRAWTQQAGNGHWLSVECEGYGGPEVNPRTGRNHEPLTPQQIEAIAQLFARGHAERGWPLQLATNPDGRGLGHHSMGCNWPGGAWGHCDCPGPQIIAQKPEIVRRTIAIVNGEGDMQLTDVVYQTKDGKDRTAKDILTALDARTDALSNAERYLVRDEFKKVHEALAGVLAAVHADPGVPVTIEAAAADAIVERFVERLRQLVAPKA